VTDGARCAGRRIRIPSRVEWGVRHFCLLYDSARQAIRDFQQFEKSSYMGPRAEYYYSPVQDDRMTSSAPIDRLVPPPMQLPDQSPFSAVKKLRLIPDVVTRFVASSLLSFKSHTMPRGSIFFCSPLHIVMKRRTQFIAQSVALQKPFVAWKKDDLMWKVFAHASVSYHRLHQTLASISLVHYLAMTRPVHLPAQTRSVSCRRPVGLHIATLTPW
jgi:hypothetical protein